MPITSKTVNAITMAQIDGRLDALTAPDLDRWFEQAFAAGQRRFLLDMARLSYISSAGLRSLLGAAKRLRTDGGTIDLCGVTGTVHEVLQVAGFLTLFRIHADERAALQVLG